MNKNRRFQNRGMGRRINREDKDAKRDEREEKALLKSFDEKIRFLSWGIVSSKEPILSLTVVFKFSKPITPNNFYKLLEDHLADKI